MARKATTYAKLLKMAKSYGVEKMSCSCRLPNSMTRKCA